MTDSAILYRSDNGHQIDIRRNLGGDVIMVVRAAGQEHIVFTPAGGRGVMHDVLVSLADQVGV